MKMPETIGLVHFIGIGGIGMNVIQGAKICGASTIIAADVFDRKLKWASTFGATHTINAEKENLVARVMEITASSGVDYAFEAISSPETIGQAFESAAKLGKIIVIGITPAHFETLPIPPLNLLLFQKTIMGSLYGTSNAQIEIPKMLYLYRNGQLKLEELITNTYTLDQINQGYQDMIDGKNIRGVVQFDDIN